MRTPTSISLSVEEYAALDQRARLGRTTRSALIRRAILVATSPIGSATNMREEMSQLRLLLTDISAALTRIAQDRLHELQPVTEVLAEVSVRLAALVASSAQCETIDDIDAASAEEA